MNREVLNCEVAKKRVIIFGDSVALGVETRKSWPQHLLEMCTILFQLYNLSISGETTKELLERVKDELARRVRAGRTRVIIQHGHNDFWEGKERKPSVDTTLSNFREILYVAQRFCDKILVVSPIWIPRYEKKEKKYREDLLEVFVGRLQELCKRSATPFLDVYTMLKQRPEFYAGERHLSELGNEKMAKTVCEALKELAWIK